MQIIGIVLLFSCTGCSGKIETSCRQHLQWQTTNEICSVHERISHKYPYALLVQCSGNYKNQTSKFYQHPFKVNVISLLPNKELKVNCKKDGCMNVLFTLCFPKLSACLTTQEKLLNLCTYVVNWNISKAALPTSMWMNILTLFTFC